MKGISINAFTPTDHAVWYVPNKGIGLYHSRYLGLKGLNKEEANKLHYRDRSMPYSLDKHKINKRPMGLSRSPEKHVCYVHLHNIL